MKFPRLLADIAISITAIAAIASAIFVVTNEISFATVTSRSMEPDISVGDVLLSRQVRPSQLAIGDVIILHLPDNPKMRFVHRVIAINQKQNQFLVTTKGDANPRPDSWLIDLVGQSVPKVFAVAPIAIIFNEPSPYLLLVLSLTGLIALLSLRRNRRLIATKAL